MLNNQLCLTISVHKYNVCIVIYHPHPYQRVNDIQSPSKYPHHGYSRSVVVASPSDHSQFLTCAHMQGVKLLFLLLSLLSTQKSLGLGVIEKSTSSSRRLIWSTNATNHALYWPYLIDNIVPCVVLAAHALALCR